MNITIRSISVTRAVPLLAEILLVGSEAQRGTIASPGGSFNPVETTSDGGVATSVFHRVHVVASGHLIEIDFL
ncbi:MAG: hypothetical protein ACI8PT_001452 [Gammaproteobacteria bacterium]|jgi:hypothetical protein